MSKLVKGFVIITDKGRYEFLENRTGIAAMLRMVDEINKLEKDGQEIERVTTINSENRKP